ncbi:hypothetical protein SKAU_G00125400 [Synaphobranchus kaupii]|uniref:Uncharacterized protein n=1 Tax=Synaphobranchus kaupii TaxID=118154 RepID=A0A9Q1J1V1_SYNKA|nr:hypothetical protein SKAU_G00125400 [Synaphobranchus kaupii]
MGLPRSAPWFISDRKAEASAFSGDTSQSPPRNFQELLTKQTPQPERKTLIIARAASQSGHSPFPCRRDIHYPLPLTPAGSAEAYASINVASVTSAASSDYSISRSPGPCHSRATPPYIIDVNNLLIGAPPATASFSAGLRRRQTPPCHGKEKKKKKKKKKKEKKSNEIPAALSGLSGAFHATLQRAFSSVSFSVNCFSLSGDYLDHTLRSYFKRNTLQCQSGLHSPG